MERKTERLLGLEVDTFVMSEALEYAYEKRGQVVTLNPEMIMNSAENSTFKEIVQEAELVIPDGVGVEIGFKILGKNNVCRLAGIEFAMACISMFHSLSLPVAFVGATQDVLELAIAELNKIFVGLNIVYSHNGFFAEENSVMDELKKSGAQLVLVALGSPKQEEFIYKIKKDMPNTLFIGVGGSFDVWSGKVERAPWIWQRLGLEWLYRTVKEPSRFKRIFPTLPLFVLRVVKERVCKC